MVLPWHVHQNVPKTGLKLQHLMQLCQYNSWIRQTCCQQRDWSVELWCATCILSYQHRPKDLQAQLRPAHCRTVQTCLVVGVLCDLSSTRYKQPAQNKCNVALRTIPACTVFLVQWLQLLSRVGVLVFQHEVCDSFPKRRWIVPWSSSDIAASKPTMDIFIYVYPNL